MRVSRYLVIGPALIAAGLPAVLLPSASAHSASSVGGVDGCVGTNLTSVSMATTTSGWAVGYTRGASALEAIALHWDGTAWHRFALPQFGRESYLYGVSALSPTKAFAVGMYAIDEQFRTLVLSWDGTRWQRVRSPNPDHDTNQLYGVSMLAADDAWAVGAYGRSRAWTLALHWDGSSWRRVRTPNPTAFDFLQSVDGANGSDVWAVGASEPGTLALHWNGSVWRQVESAGGEILDIMLGVSATATDDVWGVGSSSSSQPPYDRTLAERWDGQEWTQYDTADPGRKANVLNAVDARSSDDVWAVGAVRTGKVTSGLTQHWDGTAWHRVVVEGKEKSLTGVSSAGATEVWAVGASYGGARCLIETWDGSGWHRWRQ